MLKKAFRISPIKTTLYIRSLRRTSYNNGVIDGPTCKISFNDSPFLLSFEDAS